MSDIGHPTPDNLKNMTHKDFTAELSQRLQWTQSKTSDMLDAAVELMNEKLAEETQISVQNFGVLETRKKSERISVNPQTQERYLVPPKIVAVFKPASGMKGLFRNEEDEV